MQIRVKVAAAVGAGVLSLSGLGLALAAPGSAAPLLAPATSPTATPTVTPSAPAASTPAIPVIALPTVAPSGAPGPIDVPAGNARTSPVGGGSLLEVELLLAAGSVLLGGATVVAIRRRA